MIISVSTALFHLSDARFGNLHPATALKVERLGDDADSEDASLVNSRNRPLSEQKSKRWPNIPHWR
jgi:hypothetical protein